MNINDFFDIGNIGTRIKISNAALAFPPFKSVIEHHKELNDGYRELEYIIWKNVWNSPYNVVAPDKRDAMIKRDVFGNPDYKLSEIAKLAEARYIEEFQTSEVLDMLNSAREGIWFINQQFRNLSSGPLSDEPEKVQKMIERLGNSYKSLDILEKAAKQQTSLSSKIIGGSDVGMYELPSNTSDY